MFIIHSSIEIEAPLPRVHSALSSEVGYRAWWTEDSEFDGKHGTFRFARPNETRSVTFQLERCEASRVELTCIAEERNPDWLGTTLRFELVETPIGTRVDLVHAGYPAKNEVYERCKEAWPYFLHSLATYLMTGTGTPYPKAA